MKKLLLLCAFLSSSLFAAEIREAHDPGAIECHDEGPHGVVCHKPDLDHALTDTPIARARYHVERLHLMLSAIEQKKPLRPLPPLSKKLERRMLTPTESGQLELDIDLGGDITTKIN